MSSVEKPTVPETILKKRKTSEKNQAEAAAQALEKRKESRKKRQVIFKRAEQYVKEYRAKEREEIRLKRQAKSMGNFYIPEEPKLAFVVRLKGINKMHPKPRKTLQIMRLLQINNGVFIKLNKATLKQLVLIEPFIAWGYPSVKTVRDLIYKRGFAKVDGQRIPITSNEVIEQALGKFGIQCIEDLVHEIATVGPAFKQASNFLWPFKLSNPTGGFKGKKAVHFVQGGEGGNREDKINALIARMI